MPPMVRAQTSTNKSFFAELGEFAKLDSDALKQVTELAAKTDTNFAASAPPALKRLASGDSMDGEIS